jgi:ribose 5-phosphate isomerase A
VARLGGQTPLPVEILSFGWQTVMERLDQAGFRPVLRLAGDTPFVTDSGNLTADCLIADIADAAALQTRLAAITGVVESGLFIGLASQVMVGRAGGVEVIDR